MFDYLLRRLHDAHVLNLTDIEWLVEEWKKSEKK